MASITNSIDNQNKELCAIVTLRCMIEDYSQKNGLSFEEAFLQFASSKTYEMLFDFSTGLWREGPDYLMGLYLETMDFLPKEEIQKS